MTVQTKVSAKGQVVLPKRTRDRLGLASGTVLDVIDTAAGVELRPAKAGKSGSLEAALAHLRAAVDYKGPRLDEGDWQAGIARAAREKWGDGRR
jgi:AbrB family looped-hinge helix DNA binding protein